MYPNSNISDITNLTMTAELNSTFMTFYHVNVVKDRTYAKVTKHYHAKMKENQRRLLDFIKKDL